MNNLAVKQLKSLNTVNLNRYCSPVSIQKIYFATSSISKPKEILNVKPEELKSKFFRKHVHDVPKTYGTYNLCKNVVVCTGPVILGSHPPVTINLDSNDGEGQCCICHTYYYKNPDKNKLVERLYTLRKE